MQEQRKTNTQLLKEIQDTADEYKAKEKEVLDVLEKREKEALDILETMEVLESYYNKLKEEIKSRK